MTGIRFASVFAFCAGLPLGGPNLCSTFSVQGLPRGGRRVQFVHNTAAIRSSTISRAK
jgi:hypothetical protein